MVPDRHLNTHAAEGDDELAARFDAITQWRRGGERAPHKPLLLLYALARLQRGELRLGPFADIEDSVRRLLVDFGPPRKSFHPEYPFWHLQSGGLWEIPEREALLADLALRSRKNNPPRSVLLREAAQGGFPSEVHERLRNNPALVNRIAQDLLDDNWPPSMHQDILDAVGMPWVRWLGGGATLPSATPYCESIRTAARCAGGTADSLAPTWRSRPRTSGGTRPGGPDSEDNGLALCSFHHKALDRGAIGLDEERRILISQHLRGSRGVEEWLVRFAGERIQEPQPGTPPPAADHIAWHRREVFLGPARGSA